MQMDGKNELILMLVFSFVAGYIFSMQLLAYKYSDVTTNLNKIYMALIMSSSMGIFGAAYMLFNHYTNEDLYLLMFFIIITGLIVVSIREQYGVDKDQFLLSMIEHHSAALTMAQKIKPKTDDQQVKKLADNIIESQTAEIIQMKQMLGQDGYDIRI